MSKIVLVNNGAFADEIVMNKEGKYITLRKIGDDRKEFRYDLSNPYYEIERILHYKTKDDKRDHIDMDVEANKVTPWFAHCNLVTEDEKFAKLFIIAASTQNQCRSPIRFITALGHYKVQQFEKWLSYGVDFKKINRALERIQNGASVLDVRHSNYYVSYEPSDFEKEQIKYLRELSDHSGGIESDILYRVRRHWNPQQYQMSKKFDKLIESNERYRDAFKITEFTYRGDKETHDYLTYTRYGRDGRAEVLEIMSKWQLNPKAFCNYLLKLQFEAVDVGDLMRNYDDYLRREYEMKSRRRAKMNKYPLNWMSYYHKHHFNYQQMKSLKRTLELDDGKMEAYERFKESKKYLEYKKDGYFIRLPENVEDIADEATQLNHCLYESYTDKILDGETVILFMREIEHPDESVITVEVKYNGIEQARGHGNRDPTREEKAWLLNWADKKNLRKVIRQHY